jgi:hypothetical protein
MADIFISYAREDRECARVLAETLEHRGWSVWWDHELYAGQNFDLVIEQQIANARAAIVMWSASSVDSEYVRAEATRARELNKLLPIRIDSALVPLRFANIHTIDLSPWLAPSKSGGRIRGGSEAAGNATASLLRDLKHYVDAAVRPGVDPRGATECVADRLPAPRQEPSPPPVPPAANEFRWDERRHRKSYETFGIVEDDDWVVVKTAPVLRDDAGGTPTVVRKGLVVAKPA